jgi:murein DD-endopeptidase MepM/ murein hydrolase activator NlpD
MGYALPTDTDYVSASWQSHRNRNPPSTEPGTDYASGYGSPLFAPGDGTIVDLKSSTSSATDRYLAIDLDDGRRARSLHLAEIWVHNGWRVGRGQQIGLTGASGWGSEWGYGSHVHETLWNFHGYQFCPDCTIDFAPYVGGDTPPPEPEPEPIPEEEDDMPKNSGYSYKRESDGQIICGILNTGSGFITEWWDGGGAYNSAMAAAFDTPTFAAISESHRNAIYASIVGVRPPTSLAVDLTDIPDLTPARVSEDG